MNDDNNAGTGLVRFEDLPGCGPKISRTLVGFEAFFTPNV
jgi:hypothetical protein